MTTLTLPWFPPAPAPRPISLLELPPDDWRFDPRLMVFASFGSKAACIRVMERTQLEQGCGTINADVVRN